MPKKDAIEVEGLVREPLPNAMFKVELPNGHQVVMMAMGSTAAIFLGLSAYATASRRDFGFMGGFLTTGIVVAFLAGATIDISLHIFLLAGEQGQ